MKRKDIYIHGPDGDTSLAYRANFNLMGEDLPGPDYRRDTLYRRYVQRYALDYLLNATAGWAFMADGRGNIIQRTKYYDHRLELTCTYKYNRYDNVSEIGLVSEIQAYPQRKRIKERMVLTYDQDLQVTDKLIFNAQKQLKYREAISYYPSGRIRQTTLYAMRKEWELPIVTTIYHYHTLDDLPPVTKGL